MQKIIQTLLLTTLMAGLFCQKIVIDNSTLISSCTTGARSAVDTYLITGTIDNITMAVNQNWQRVVVITKLKITSSTNEIVCQFNIGIGTCQSFPASTCVCFYNTTTDQAGFTLSDNVKADDSNATIHVQWQHATNRTIIYSNKNFTFPEIYDVNAAQLNLTVAGVTGNLPSGSCSFSLTLNKSNDLELCCSNTATPCYPQIALNGAVVANNIETCVTYPGSKLASDEVTGNLVLSYSMCTKTGYTQGSSCSVIPQPVSPESSDDNKCNLICKVLVPVIVVIIIIVGGIAVYCCKAKKCCCWAEKCCCKAKMCCCWANKTSQAVSSQGPIANAEKAHTSEHPKKDGQYPVYTNQAYDVRRSSPSDVTINGVNTPTNDNFQQDNTVQQKDSNKGRTNDGSASQTVPRQLPPVKVPHGQLHSAAAKSRPVSIEITSNKA